MSIELQQNGPLIVCVLLLLVLCGRASRAEAQFSPGPLARVHEDLEGALNCLKCHGIGRDQNISNQCMACHEGIGQLVSEGRGLHGQAESGECASCHPDHAGRDFPLIDDKALQVGTFDHASTGWPLNGKHADATCGVCHKQELRKSPIVDLLKGGHRPWIGLETNCASCHEDVHAGRLGTACADCHVETSFLDVATTGFDHARTAYPLRGAHAAVDCQACHGEAERRVARPAFQSCGDCHTDAHAGQATLAGRQADCAACHTVNRFSPSTYTVARHAQSPFPLDGKHELVPCASCHTGNTAGLLARDLGSAGVSLRPPHALCADCHQDAHAGQLTLTDSGGECASCHTTADWSPSTFTTQDHASLPFALEGAHAGVSCEKCHGTVREFLPVLADHDLLGPAGIFFGLDGSACIDCHMNPHGAKYAGSEYAGSEYAGSEAPDRAGNGREVIERAGTCADCHNVQGFTPTLVDAGMHARFSFPLEGAHAAVPCFACHADMAHQPLVSTLSLGPPLDPPLAFTVADAACADCHQDPHRAQFAPDCAQCHDQNAFRPAPGFVHDRDSSFPLEGAHSNVACAACHKSESDAAGAFTRFKPIDASCESCHSDGVPVGRAKS